VGAGFRPALFSWFERAQIVELPRSSLRSELGFRSLWISCEQPVNDATLNRINELSAAVAPMAYRFIRDARLDGAPVVIVESYRTQARQNALYAQGRTKPGQVVTWTQNSLHTRRRAFDVAFVVNGRVTFDVPRTWWDYLGATAARYGLRWGPTIGLSGDLGHYES